MQLIEVNTPSLVKDFVEINALLNQSYPNYIRPLDKDVINLFEPAKNKFLKEGKAIRWVLKNEAGRYIGRIAAFTHPKYLNKGDKQPTGCFGFFDCIDDDAAAHLLFDAAKNWLQQQGMEAMDGPVNLGERDRWWGLTLESKDPPLYGMHFHPPFYKRLFENYGMQVFYYQNCWFRKVADPLDQRFFTAHQKIASRGGFTAEMVKKNNLEKYAKDFVTIYNSAWASHEGNKEMPLDTAVKIFNAMKPVMDEKIAWFAYYKGDPVAMYINLPDLNEIFRKFNGRFGLLEKLRFLWFKKFTGFTKMVGIIFGVVPRFQGLGVDYFLIIEAAKIIQRDTRYYCSELQWQGDFHPKMNNISKNLGFTQSRLLATYRYLFDRSQPFERHPMLL
jgi:hypothetical protein